MTSTDRILKIGKKLEKKGLEAFGSSTPGGHPAYFRAHGLQIIPTEAEEIDTGKTCRLVITSLAAKLSGLVIELLKVLRALPAGQKRVEGLIEELKARVFKDMPTSEQWEVTAAKDIVSASLKLVERRFEDPPATDGDDWSGFDPFTGEINARRRYRWIHAQESLFHHSGQDRTKDTQPIEARYSKRAFQTAASPQWVAILGHLGVVIAGFWIPVVRPTSLAGPVKQVGLLKALHRKKLKPDIALTIIANAQKRPNRKSR